LGNFGVGVQVLDDFGGGVDDKLLVGVKTIVDVDASPAVAKHETHTVQVIDRIGVGGDGRIEQNPGVGVVGTSVAEAPGVDRHLRPLTLSVGVDAVFIAPADPPLRCFQFGGDAIDHDRRCDGLWGLLRIFVIQITIIHGIHIPFLLCLRPTFTSRAFAVIEDTCGRLRQADPASFAPLPAVSLQGQSAGVPYS
jgi:hypothetical protein